MGNQTSTWKGRRSRSRGHYLSFGEGMQRLSTSIRALIDHEKSALNSASNGQIKPNNMSMNRVRKELVKNMQKHPKHNMSKSKSKDDHLFQRSVETLVDRVGSTLINDVLGPFPSSPLSDNGDNSSDKFKIPEYAPIENQQDRVKDACFEAFGLWMPTVWQSDRCPVSFPWIEYSIEPMKLNNDDIEDDNVGGTTGAPLLAPKKNLRDCEDEVSSNN